MPPPVPRTLLVILDGWGERAEREGNAIRLAATPGFERLRDRSLSTLLSASGEDVGLPDGMMGNSEVGHLNLGAGRIVYQDILRITRAARDGSLAAIPAIAGLLRGVRERGSALHLMGLVSDGGVHALDRHLFALLGAAREAGAGDVRVHAFLDGRDTPPASARGYLHALEAELAASGGRIATVSGRYFAMDRDRRWERTERAWRAIALGEGPRVASADAAVEASYGRDVTDEFVEPVVVGEPGARGLRDGDGVLFFNFRADRARQLASALTDPGFDGFARPRMPRVEVVTMTRYDPALDAAVAFPPVAHRGIFADVVAALGGTTLRVAETEKYAHVTYFFNGGVEAPWPGEERVLVPSPRVATYDLKPEMSAHQVTGRIVEAMRAAAHPVIIANYANADMVGHTGQLDATIRAIEVLDGCLGQLDAEAEQAGYGLFVTADHGNAEQMIDPVTGGPHTAHTTHPVPLIARAPGLAGSLAPGGRLGDVVPTLLDWWGARPSPEMTGASLLRRS